MFRLNQFNKPKNPEAQQAQKKIEMIKVTPELKAIKSMMKLIKGNPNALNHPHFASLLSNEMTHIFSPFEPDYVNVERPDDLGYPEYETLTQLDLSKTKPFFNELAKKIDGPDGPIAKQIMEKIICSFNDFPPSEEDFIILADYLDKSISDDNMLETRLHEMLEQYDRGKNNQDVSNLYGLANDKLSDRARDIIGNFHRRGNGPGGMRIKKSLETLYNNFQGYIEDQQLANPNNFV